MLMTVETAKWQIFRDKFGNARLVRLSDGASLFMQGDDATQLWRDLHRASQKRLGSMPLDCVADGYSEILEPVLTCNCTCRPATLCTCI